jgi:anaphase-promoting complex subunit 6
MAAYRSAFRLFPGCHLPLVGMAMECSRQKNGALAEQYLQQAHALCPWDPLVLNELGVLKSREDK